MSEILPKGWATCLMRDIAIIVGGGTPKSKDETNFAEASHGIPWLTPKDLSGYNKIFITNGERYLSEKGLAQSSAKLLSKGAVLFTSRAPIGYVAIASNEIATNQGFKSFVCADGICNKYIYFYLKYALEDIKKMASGTTFAEISGKKAGAIPIRIAPTSEQKRIAEKLEQLLTAVDATKNRLDKVPTILKRFRQSVLAAAVSGELTKDWREEHDISDKSPINPDVNAYPSTWKQIPLAELSKSISYGSSKKSQKEGDVPVIRMGNIQQGEIDWENLVYTSDKDEIEKYVLAPGDVLFNRTNSPELVGKTAIYRGERKAINAGYLIKVCTSDKLDPEYLNICLNSPYGRDYCWQVKTDVVSQSNINAKKLAAFPIPLPSKKEQIEIASRVQTLLTVAIQVGQQLDNSRKTVEKIGQSILVKAFKGELVPQDPNDETATLLLKKIAETNRKQKVSKPVRRRKKAMPSKAKKGSLHSIVEILQSSKKPVSAQQLLAVLAPGSPDSEEVEDFFVALRDCLSKNEIMRERKGDEDWFSLATGTSAS